MFVIFLVFLVVVGSIRLYQVGPMANLRSKHRMMRMMTPNGLVSFRHCVISLHIFCQLLLNMIISLPGRVLCPAYLTISPKIEGVSMKRRDSPTSPPGPAGPCTNAAARQSANPRGDPRCGERQRKIMHTHTSTHHSQIWQICVGFCMPCPCLCLYDTTCTHIGVYIYIYICISLSLSVCLWLLGIPTQSLNHLLSELGHRREFQPRSRCQGPDLQQMHQAALPGREGRSRYGNEKLWKIDEHGHIWSGFFH